VSNKEKTTDTNEKKEVLNITVTGVKDLTKNPVKYPGVAPLPWIHHLKC
jgi:hypothetical protein